MKKLNIVTADELRNDEDYGYGAEYLPCGSAVVTYWDDAAGRTYAECDAGHIYVDVEDTSSVPGFRRWTKYTRTPADELDDMVGGPAIWMKSTMTGIETIPALVTGWHKSASGRVWVDLRAMDGAAHAVKEHNIITPARRSLWDLAEKAAEAEAFALAEAQAREDEILDTYESAEAAREAGEGYEIDRDDDDDSVDEQDSPYDSPTDGQWR